MANSPKQGISFVKGKRGRPPKCIMPKKKVLVIEDNMTVNQLVCRLVKEKAKCQKWKRVTPTYDDLYENNSVKFAVMERAKEIQANLSSEFPSMIKCMLPSHVTRGFWLGLAKEFCSENLPKEDGTIVLEDEEGKEYETKYLVEKVGLSAGWRGFSIAHKIMEGDVCVFHLVEPTKFKVYIVRKSGLEEVDVALGLMKLESSSMDLGEESKISAKTIDQSLGNDEISKEMDHEWKPKICEKAIVKFEKNDFTRPSCELEHTADLSANDSMKDELGIRLCESLLDFKEVKSFEDFDIVVNGLIINSKLSEYTRMKYYELCCSQESYLHDHLLEGLNCDLVAGIISQTVDIAGAIRAAKLTTTSESSLLKWKQTLESIQGLGMNVGFISARLDQLMNLFLKYKRYREARLEQVNAQKEKRKIEAELREVTEELTRLDGEIGLLKEENAGRLKFLFYKVAKIPY